jgi:ketosteroid isomerase-like protein
MSTVDTTEANRHTVRAAFEAWQRGDAPITDVFAPDMTWRVEGHSRAAGDYRDTEDFVERVLAPFGRRFSTDRPFRPTSIRAVHADGDTVIVLWDGRGITVDGSAYENSYASFMRLRDGKVVDGVAFFDSISFDRLWTTVQPAT